MRSESELRTVYETMLKTFNHTHKRSSGYYPVKFEELQTLEYVFGEITLEQWHKSIADLINKEEKEKK